MLWGVVLLLTSLHPLESMMKLMHPWKYMSSVFLRPDEPLKRSETVLTASYGPTKVSGGHSEALDKGPSFGPLGR